MVRCVACGEVQWNLRFARNGGGSPGECRVCGAELRPDDLMLGALGGYPRIDPPADPLVQRGPILSKKGQPRRYRYRFANPLMQPYVTMRGLASGLITQASG